MTIVLPIAGLQMWAWHERRTGPTSDALVFSDLRAEHLWDVQSVQQGDSGQSVVPRAERAGGRPVGVSSSLEPLDATSDTFRGELESLVRGVWERETGKPLSEVPDGLGKFELADDCYSIGPASNKSSLTSAWGHSYAIISAGRSRSVSFPYEPE